MRRLVLVKHSMPEIDPDKPASAWKLGEVGRRHSELLASKLKEFSPDVIWSSKEPKAVETAEIVANELSVPVEIADGLEEHHRENVPFLSSKEEFEGAIERFFLCPDRLVLGRETANQARDRFAAAIDEVIDAGQTDSVIVTHGTVMSLYVASVASVQTMEFWRRLGLPSYVVLTLPDMRIKSIVEDVITVVEPSAD